MVIAQKLEQLDGAVGSWWLSTSPDVREPGVIRRDAERGVWTLAVYGSILGSAGKDMKWDTGRQDGGAMDHGLRIFGVTIAGEVTLSMSSRVRRQSSGPDRRQEEWEAFTALLGKHAESEQRWTSTRLELPLVWDWFSPTALERIDPSHTDPLDSDYYEELSADWKDFTVGIWRGTAETFDRRKRGLSGIGGFVLEHESGFLLEEIAKPVLALQSLHEVLYGEPSRPEGQTLQPLAGSPMEKVLELQARRAVFAEPSLPDPYFGTGEVDFASFVPAWISLHVDAEVWPSIGPPPGAKSWMQTELVESVNAAEAFARQLGLMKGEPPKHEIAVLNAISELPKRTIKYAERALMIARDTLAQRLELLARTIGTASAAWLLGDVTSWATTVANSRNALSHGFASREGLEKDPQAMGSMLTSLKVVLRLSMLRTAGFVNGQTGTQVELLADFAGNKLIRHPNSVMAKELQWIHGTPKAWMSQTGE